MTPLCGTVIASDRTALAPTAEAPAQARRWARWLGPHLASETEEALRIVISELVSNSVVHAGLDNAQRIDVSADVYRDCISVTVCDHGRGIPAGVSRLRPEATRPGRRGMFLVHRLATRVRIDGPRGKVSFQLPRHPG